MGPPKAIPPPSRSSSGSGSESATSSSSSDEEEQQQRQKQQQKQAAQGKASPPPPQKKAAVPKQPQRTKPQQQAASPPPVKKKPALNGEKKPPPPAPRPAAVPAAAADGESSSEEEASDSPPEAKPAAKPAPSRSRLRSPKPASSAEPAGSSKPKEPPPAAASQQLRKEKKRKRQRQDVEDAEEGEAATAADAGGSSSKKLFQRVWTEENVVALLQGMLEFQEKHDGTHPLSDMDTFSEFISAALRGGFSKTQLYYKIRRLREKYERNRRRGKDGADPSFAKPHEQVTFELSKRAWPAVEGDTHNHRAGDTGVKTKDKGGKRDRQRAKMPYPMLAQAISLLETEDGNSVLAKSASRALESLKPTEAKALEQRWNKHFMAEAKYYVERAGLKKDLLQTLVKAVETE